jgi:integrase
MGNGARRLGSLYQRSDGRWAVAISLGRDGGRRVRKHFLGRTAEEAQAKLREALAGDRAPEPAADEPSNGQTLREFLSYWLDEFVRLRVRERTFISYEGTLRVHVLPALGAVPLRSLTPLQVQELLGAKARSGLSPRSVAYIRTVLRAALSQAVKWELVQRNAAALAEPPRQERKEIRPLTPEEARTLLDAAKGDRFEAMLVLAVTTGLRLGELRGLMWEDVNLEEGVLHVRRQLQRIERKLVLTDLKTHHSRRTVFLPELAVKVLREHRDRQAAELASHAGTSDQSCGDLLAHARASASLCAAGPSRGDGAHHPAASDVSPAGSDLGTTSASLIFTTRNGTPLDQKHVQRPFHALLKKAGLGRIRFHDLRHTCASLLLAQNVHPKVVQNLLGHSQIGITMDIYSHVMPSAQRDASRQIDELLG